MELITKEIYNCPFCDENHELEIYQNYTKGNIDNIIFEYEEVFYYCPIEKERFTTKEMTKKNLLAARDSYKIFIDRLTSTQIRDGRTRIAGLNQKEFSNMLGWGDVTIQRYETKAIQDETYDQKMRMAIENPKFALNELEKHKDRFSSERYNGIKSTLMEQVKTKAIQFLSKEIIESLYIEYKEPSIINGHKSLDLSKVVNLITYFATYSKKLYKVKLMKLLWYTDSLHFKKYGVGMSGLVYKHLPLGAVPQGHEDLLRYSRNIIDITEEYVNEFSVAYRILPKVDMDLNSFDINELNILNAVIQKFDSMGSRQISDYMHDEVAYQETNNNEIIPYSLAAKMREF